MKDNSTNKTPSKPILVLASTFPRWKDDTTPPFVLELEKRLTDDSTLFLLAPHAAGAKDTEVLENISVTRFHYFWPARLEKLCYDGGILPNLKKNKLLYVQAITLILCELAVAISLVKKKRIQLIHAHWIIPQGIIALLIKKFFGVPYIITTHGGDIYGLQNSILQSLKKSILINAARITVVSNAIKKEILETIDSKLAIEVISMGVDAAQFTPDKYDKKLKQKLSNDGPLLLFVGRLAEKKGVEYAIGAMPAIHEEFPNAVLTIIGEGVQGKELREFADELLLHEHVLFLGGMSNAELPKYYASADLFLGPSIKVQGGDTEGLGLTFVEASFSGCIPIGTNVGGISDVIANGETGYLVPEKDAKSIAETVIKLLKNPGLMKKLSHQAREQTIKKFDWRKIAEKYKNIYLSVN